MAKSPWSNIAIHPLVGPLDTRSRPADLIPGAFRWKLNFAANSEGKLCRRTGHQRFASDALFDDNGLPLSDPLHGSGSHYHNHDHHHQGATREPITFLYESTASDGTRRLFDGTQSRVSVLNFDDGSWFDVITGKGATGSKWHADELQNVITFVNNVDAPLYVDVSTPYTPTAATTIPSLNTIQMERARVAVEFQGFMLLMNVREQGTDYTSRIRWSDLNLPLEYAEGNDSLAGFQDLDYGDEILNAKPIGNYLYVYTRRAIWKIGISGNEDSVFSFAKVYYEPDNQAGCLAYADTLISTGAEHWYMAQDGIYNFNPYIAAPARQDWLYLATGVIYKTASTRLDTNFCPSPVGEYLPNERELWFSWPTVGVDGINNITLVAQIEQKTADVVDTGYTALSNFRRTPANANECNEVQDLLGASNVDWCIKSIGNVYFREYAFTQPDLTEDIPDEATYYNVGYNSMLRGLIPTGLFDCSKTVRSVSVEHDTAAQDTPCAVKVRIGQSRVLVDPNDAGDICVPSWHELPTKLLQCPDMAKLSELKKKNQVPNLAMEFQTYDSGRFLYYEITIQNADGTAAIGGNSCWMSITFDAKAEVKARVI